VAAEVQAALLPGMMLEDKDLTLTVHYRQAQLEPDVLDEFTQMIKAAAKRLGLNLFEGRKVYELRPPVGVDKGTALANLLKDFNVQAAVYLGDDTTDVAAFEKAGLLRSKGECQVYAIGVLSNNTPAGVLEKADYSAEGVEDVAKFFAFLADSASASST
jgi:trehalose 6-phosphate phosphatase